MRRSTHFNVATDVAYGHKPPGADFRSARECCCQPVVVTAIGWREVFGG